MSLDADRKKARDQRMDDLVKLTKSWSASTQAEYNARVKMLKALLAGRGVGQVAQTTVGVASQLVVDEVNDFLTG